MASESEFFLDSISLSNWRCFEQQNIASLHPKLNWFIGENGAGKTSILEAVYFSGRARSFREAQPKNLIRKEASQAISFLAFNTKEKLGSQLEIKSRSTKTLFKLNGEFINQRSLLLEFLPVVALTPRASQIIDGEPAIRRSFLDWLLFHVEHSYLQKLKNCQRLIKHRNALLRRVKHTQTSEAIDPEEKSKQVQALLDQHVALLPQLLSLSYELSAYREKVTQELTAKVNAILWSGDYAIKECEIKLHKGWASEKNLEDIWANIDSDIARAVTLSGPHRYDISLLVNKQRAKSFLSSGQKKILATALTLAAAEMIGVHGKKKPMVLVDDIAAELDIENLTRLLNGLLNNRGVGQILVASNYIPPEIDAASYKVFHVEHGAVKPI